LTGTRTLNLPGALGHRSEVSHAPHACRELTNYLATSGKELDDPDYPFVYIDTFREYGVKIEDDGLSHVVIAYCPFCAVALPPSLRDAWFERLDELGLEPEDAAVPGDMRDGTWARVDHTLKGVA